jgi:hypothetical protein
MQLVTVEVCASRILPVALATPIVPTHVTPSHNVPSSTVHRRMIAPRAILER